MESTVGVVYSLKGRNEIIHRRRGTQYHALEYEDLVIDVVSNKKRMKAWRSHVERKRRNSYLFDTQVGVKPHDV